ncbi:MAG: hypothetical protein ACI396_05740, partial [Acutalibacteraceae bacterium]
FAAYTNINRVKRVVSTQGENNVAFSSNYLTLLNSDVSTFDLKRISIPKSSNTGEFTITVCNYVHSNPSILNTYDISYNMMLTLVDAVTGESVTTGYDAASVSFGENSYSFTNGVCTIENQSLTGKVKSIDTYNITVPSSFIDKINIKAEATPDSSSLVHTNNYKLAREFAFAEYSDNTTSWTGSFAETDVNSYDGFNYVLKGQGEGTVTLTWDSSQLEISQVFLNNYSLIASVGSGNQMTVMFSVNSNEKNRYDIQFYKTENGSYSDINVLNSYVSCAFVERVASTTAS